MLDGIINLALLTGAALCVWFLAYGSYHVVKFLFGREGLRRVIARLALYESTHLDQYAE
jgi:hypothetical protein